jgi:hypothetical protein
MDSKFDDHQAVAEAVERGDHRDIIGGMWEEIGVLQFEFVTSRGLRPHHFLLDIGCGSLRGGVHFISYLEIGHYYGTDINRSLLDAGYEREVVPAGLSNRLPRRNLICDGDFNIAACNQIFDVALAQSVFTHLSFNRIRLCLERLAPYMAPSGELYATYFHLPQDRLSGDPLKHSPGGAMTFGYKDPFHYRVSDFLHAIEGLPWRLEVVGEWNHPRAQRMLSFIRT